MGNGTHMDTVSIVSAHHSSLIAHMHLASKKNRLVAPAILKEALALCMECKLRLVMPQGFACHWECFRDLRKAERSRQHPRTF